MISMHIINKIYHLTIRVSAVCKNSHCAAYFLVMRKTSLCYGLVFANSDMPYKHVSEGECTCT